MSLISGSVGPLATNLANNSASPDNKSPEIVEKVGKMTTTLVTAENMDFNSKIW